MIIDGKLQSEKLRKKIKDELTKICKNTKDVPKLSVILIGDYLPSQIYVKNKQKKASGRPEAGPEVGFGPGSGPGGGPEGAGRAEWLRVAPDAPG